MLDSPVVHIGLLLLLMLLMLLMLMLLLLLLLRTRKHHYDMAHGALHLLCACGVGKHYPAASAL
jgi:hypothetical protein